MTKPFTELVTVLAGITDREEMTSFLREMLTEKEMNDVALRWQLLKELYRGETQRTIAARHKLSLCKITRGSKILKADNSVTRKILDHRQQKRATETT